MRSRVHRLCVIVCMIMATGLMTSRLVKPRCIELFHFRVHGRKLTVAELLLVRQVAKGLKEVIGLLVGDEEEQSQEFAMNAARGRHTRRQERYLTVASLGVAILTNLDGSGVLKDLIRLVGIAQLCVFSFWCIAMLR